MQGNKIRNMDEFAALCGISRPTVSKYFHDPASVRPKTRARIEQALADYDYTPNIFAMNQNRKLTKNVGIVVPYLADPFFAEIARNLEQRCIDAGYRPSLHSSHGKPELENDILDSLRSLKPAGVLLAPLGRVSDPGVIEKFCADVPTVLFDSYLPDAGLAFVGSDNPQFSRLMVDYLCRTGEPPCFFEMKHPTNPNANRRRQSYIQAMTALGHEPQIFQAEGKGWDFEEIGRREGGRALAEGAFRTNTVLCSNDRLAIGFLSACYESKIRVGIEADCDIRVAGHDDHPFSRFTCPSLTTVAQDYEEISRRSVELLFAAIEGDKTEGTAGGTRQDYFLEGSLIMRKSA
ncbi:DNA-binding transcriptional regulator, LacI/PurR family [Pseudooceanicola nitratireducens]|jgi:DNA-binding LacI/PurR family transcriptional regulator|uniref:DNA-binding transcriptional regulator, LacI/PurR family n=1 Tax=Pseudooceanicola nitratireducens TaxID=517719 RepID=A0A1I1NIA9_9RHOB|nr:LacI family DNA-binding transcriptional regulator [Pseudooceanicola nitratireducens]SEI69284.1 DNA-binding transcriptional regulator, LacI/PurR family [Pseudooceanicola nitratireducens]SFC97444.1 DNA-binding transcriptional regulator, LacI/PurR family [Pseudooceanicola nitratireducens]